MCDDIIVCGTVRESVYCIRATLLNVYKIGRSTDFTKRIKTLQTASPTELEVVCAWEGNHKDERELHRKYKSKNKHGEWFYLSQEDIDDILVHARKRNWHWIPENT